jgi:hypothetical protein
MIRDDYSFKDKEELDTMSKQEIKDYRYDIIQNNAGWSDDKNIDIRRKAQSDWKQYLEELEVYNQIRFKQDTFDMYDKWIAQADTDDTYKMMSKLVDTEEGKERMYSMSVSSSLQKIGEFKYILGLEININHDVDSFVKLLTDKIK